MPASNTSEKFVSVKLPVKFIDLYSAAKDAILFFETHEMKMAPGAIIDLRDALDHIVLAFMNSEDEERVLSETNCAVEHLRRASIEPIEWAIENVIADLHDRHRMAWWNKILLVSLPKRESYYPALVEIKKELLEGRKCKSMEKWEEGILHFKTAYHLACGVQSLFPEKEITNSRIFAIVLAVISFCLGLIVG